MEADSTVIGPHQEFAKTMVHAVEAMLRCLGNK